MGLGVVAVKQLSYPGVMVGGVRVVAVKQLSYPGSRVRGVRGGDGEADVIPRS